MYLRNRSKRPSKGFTLLELLIAIAIVAILAAIAIPSYYHYMKKAEYSAIVQAGDSYKTYVAACAQQEDAITTCSSGTSGLPAGVSLQTVGAVKSLSVAGGVITVIPIATGGIKTADTYVLTPAYNATTKVVTWMSSGGGCDNGFANCPVAVVAEAGGAGDVGDAGVGDAGVGAVGVGDAGVGAVGVGDAGAGAGDLQAEG